MIINEIKTIFYILLSVFFTSCGTDTGKNGNFKLLPLPQEYKITGTSKLNGKDLYNYYSDSIVELPYLKSSSLPLLKFTNNNINADIIYEVDHTLNLKAEGYKLEITQKQIQIKAKDKAGLLYAFMTLNQLMEDAKEQEVNLPLCKITDYPTLAYRAIHLDIKHHLEKTEYYYQLMDKLASYKVNAIIVELEDKIAYKKHPLIGSDDALSIEEWKKLCNYAMERNIEISPLVQGLGHASFILKHDEYKSLRDNPERDWEFNPLDPKTYELQFDLYDEAMEATPHGKYLHVGGDEVHTSGRGSGKSALELQLMWLDKVCKYAEEKGRIPIFWDDMPLKHAGVYQPMFDSKMAEAEVDSVWAKNEHKLLEFLDQFPKNCIYMRWNYSNSDAIGNEKAMEWFLKNNLQVMGATAGQTRWVLMPQQESNMNNIRTFTESTINSGLDALLLTLWDDDSPHFELYNRGIVAFAEYTWAGVIREKEAIKSAYRQREFSSSLADPEFAFVDDLEMPVAFWKNALLKGNRRNYLIRMGSSANEALIELPDLENKGKWSEKYTRRLDEAALTLETCKVVGQKIEVMKNQAKRNHYSLEIYEQVNNLVNFTSGMLLKMKALDDSENEQAEKEAIAALKKLPDEFTQLRKEFEEVYGKTRILTKPDNYILDQDHHVHLANQALSFDWQFYSEILMLEEIKTHYK